MTSSELAQAIYAGNDVAMQWYALAHPAQFPPAGVVTVEQTPAGATMAIGSGVLWVAALGVVAVFLLSRR